MRIRKAAAAVLVLIVILCVILAAVLVKNGAAAKTTTPIDLRTGGSTEGGSGDEWWEQSVDRRNFPPLNKFVDAQIVRKVSQKNRGPLRRVLRQVFATPGRRREHLERAREIYQRAQTKAPPAGRTAAARAAEGRAESRVEAVRKYIEPLGPDQAYLDVGCGDANITRAIGAHLGIPSARRYCADVKDPPADPSGLTYLRTDGKTIPLPDNRAGLITAFMSMHHFGPNLIPMLKEMRRVLAPGGLLVIREHDIGMTGATPQYLDWVHQIYSVVAEGDGVSSYEPADYRSAAEWDITLETHGGFGRVAGPDPANDRFFSYVAAYRSI